MTPNIDVYCTKDIVHNHESLSLVWTYIICLHRHNRVMSDTTTDATGKFYGIWSFSYYITNRQNEHCQNKTLRCLAIAQTFRTRRCVIRLILLESSSVQVQSGNSILSNSSSRHHGLVVKDWLVSLGGTIVSRRRRRRPRGLVGSKQVDTDSFGRT